MVWIQASHRTPFAKYKGAFCFTRCEDLLVPLLQHHAAISVPEAVYIGCANQAGEDARNVARLATLIAGLPSRVVAVTFNSLCSSSLSALEHGFLQLKLKRANTLWVGGVEHMSRAPLACLPPHALQEGGASVMEDTRFGWRFRHPHFASGVTGYSMQAHAEAVAITHGISSIQMDGLALRSHAQSLKAYPTPDICSTGLPLSYDECPRPGLGKQHLMRLKPMLGSEGLHTVAHMAPFADGASGVLLSSGKVPFADYPSCIELVDVLAIATAPQHMPLAGLNATQALLKQHGLSSQEMACIELHEAFASACLIEAHLLGINPLDNHQVNNWGGTLALGSPMGANGTALIGRLAHRLAYHQQTHKGSHAWGIASLASGMGLGYAVLLKSYSD